MKKPPLFVIKARDEIACIKLGLNETYDFKNADVRLLYATIHRRMQEPVSRVAS